MAEKQVHVSRVTAVSDWGPPYGIQNLIDNNFDSYFSTSSTHPHPQRELLWIQIHLSKAFMVSKVILFNRKDDATDHRKRTMNLGVRVGTVSIDMVLSHQDQLRQIESNEWCAKFPRPALSGERIEMRCPAPMRGDSVSIHGLSNEVDYLIIAELQVYGKGK